MRDVRTFKSALELCACVEKSCVMPFLFSLVSVFRQRGRFCLTTQMGLLTHFSQEEPFDLSQKPPGMPSLRLSQSDGESVPGSSCQEEEDEESLYRRSQYSPEVDQHEPTGEDEYIPELEERGERSPAELSPGEKRKETYQESLDDEAFERESAAEGQSGDPRGAQVHLSQSEAFCESDTELGEQEHHRETGRRRTYDYDSDSELEEDHQEPDEPEKNKMQLGGFYEAAIDVSERNQIGEMAHHMHASEFMGPQDEEEDKE